MGEKRENPYAIGSDQWPGLAKLIEECGEVIQDAGKVIGSATWHKEKWNPVGLHRKLETELGDLLAAIHVVIRLNKELDRKVIHERRALKKRQYLRWHGEVRGDS